MKSEFIERVIREGIVDTKTYRYVYKCFADHAEIQRISISSLGTTDAINGWEVVKVIK